MMMKRLARQGSSATRRTSPSATDHFPDKQTYLVSFPVSIGRHRQSDAPTVGCNRTGALPHVASCDEGKTYLPAE
jgi:hypothetical protein